MSDYYVYGDIDIIPTATMGFVSLVEWSFIDSIKEYGAFNKIELTDDKISIKSICIKLQVNRIGLITKVYKH